jgi:hypothetical protein
MNLRYIHLGLDYDDYIDRNNDLRFEFQQHTNFIDDYFSKAIRKFKFKTDGTFNMISICPTEYKVEGSTLVPIDVLKVELSFDKLRYEKIKGTEDCSYYLELLAQGFKKAAELKPIPLTTLLDLIEYFKQGDCRNEWVEKKKRFKENDLEVILTCEFTTNYFQLIITINQISTKKELVKGVIIRTDVGVSIHEGMYKDIIIDKDIIIIDESNSPRIIINYEKIFESKLDFKIEGDEKIKDLLSYQYKK